jgi:hypothetical protein
MNKVVLNRKSIFIMVCALILFACNSSPKTKLDTNSPKMKLDIDPIAGTFGFVDIKSGKRLSYNKLILDGKEVADTHCSGNNVTFVFDKGDIIRNDNSTTITTGQAYTGHAVLKYELSNGVLTILELDN